MKKTMVLKGLLIAALMWCQGANAAVSSEEAAKLNSTLTPTGAERAGNQGGTIPAWEGGYITQIPGDDGKSIPSDPFASDKVLYTITAQNMEKYADKLSEGTKAMLKLYPDTFRIDVFPTRRTFAAPKWVYDNTLKNATTGKLVENGVSVEGVYGGIPFPIPQNGTEVMWNHTLHVRNQAIDFYFKNIVGASNGKISLAGRTLNHQTAPYYYPEQAQKDWDGRYLMTVLETTEPAFKAGEMLLITDSVENGKQREAYQYLVGQRRVRRAPTVGYDTPDFVASGANYFDEVIGLYGPLDRYDWKLVGKKEILIPYNDNAFFKEKIADAFQGYHLNPAKVRWELHRVWVVEANVAQGKRHVVPKRTYYLDEDNWSVTLVDGYDAAGKLWRTSQVLSFIAPSIPLMVTDTTMVFNLQAKTFSAIQSFNEEPFEFVKHRPLTYWSPASLGSGGVR